MTAEVIPRTSEDQWLAERMKRVTATDVAKLANGGPAVKATLKREKQGERTFFGNAFTRWGQEREPFIMDRLGFLFGLEPNEDLYVDGRWAATPDGVNRSMSRLAEVKTTGVDWWQGDHVSTLEHIRRVKPEYYDQVQWALMVADYFDTVFAWEVRLGSPGAFEPGEFHYVIIPRDDARIAELVEIATDFVQFCDEPDEDVSEWDEFMARYAVADAELKEKQAEVDRLKQELRDKQGDTPLAVDTPFGKISYAFPKPRKAFDTAGFKKEHGDLYKQFLKQGEPGKPRLTITPKG